VRRDEIDGGGEFRIVAPSVPDIASRDGHVHRFLDTLDLLNQFVNFLQAGKNGLVANHDAVDVAVALGQRDRRLDFAVVALRIFIYPGTQGDLHAEFCGNRWHQFATFRRRVQTDGARQGGESFQIGANFFGVDGFDDDVARFKRRVRKTRQDAAEIGSRLLVLEQTPQRSVSCGYKQQDGNDGAHR
jgi:hypothetical protein